MIRVLTFLCTVLLGLTASAFFRQGGQEGNGGSVTAIEFQQVALQAVADIERHFLWYPELAHINLRAVLQKAVVLSTEGPLLSSRNGIEQDSTAVNHHDPDTILVSESQWSTIKSLEVKKTLALHELLSLAGLERTGSYQISNRYLNSLGISCHMPFCDFSNDDWTSEMPLNRAIGASLSLDKVIDVEPGRLVVFLEDGHSLGPSRADREVRGRCALQMNSIAVAWPVSMSIGPLQIRVTDAREETSPEGDHYALLGLNGDRRLSGLICLAERPQESWTAASLRQALLHSGFQIHPEAGK